MPCKHQEHQTRTAPSVVTDHLTPRNCGTTPTRVDIDHAERTEHDRTPSMSVQWRRVLGSGQAQIIYSCAMVPDVDEVEALLVHGE
jgi:hypothetical protein